jgi:hypothetical protein
MPPPKRGLGSTDIASVSSTPTARADFLRDLTAARTSAAGTALD